LTSVKSGLLTFRLLPKWKAPR